MADETAYCVGPECDRPVFRGELCQGHVKQLQRGQKLSPLAEALTPRDRFFEAVAAYSDAGDDEGEYEDRKQKLIYAGRQLFGDRGGAEALQLAIDVVEARRADAIRNGLKTAKANGVRLGRPRKCDWVEVAKAAQCVHDTAQLAKRFGVNRRTVQRAVRMAMRTLTAGEQ
jgi:hypothetical protein